MNLDLTSKIQKLLRLSLNNPSQKEAESAMAKAQELAVAAGIDLAVLELQGQRPKKEEITEEFVDSGKRFPIEYKFITGVVTKFLDVTILFHGNRDYGRKVSFIGPKTESEFAKWLYSYLIDEFYSLWEDYRTKNPLVGTKLKNSYYLGIYNALIRRIDAIKSETINNNSANVVGFAPETVQKQYAVMIVTKKEEINQFVGKKYPKLKKGYAAASFRADSNVINDGYNAGQNISLNRPLMG